MIDLKKYISTKELAYEASSKDVKATPIDQVDPDEFNDQSTNGGKKQATDKVVQQDGKSSSANGSSGIWAIDPPHGDAKERWEAFDPKVMSKNKRKLAARFNGDGSDFLVLGDAGWAKTALIEDVAKTAGYHICTVYLDKAVATDLGGIPVPTKNEVTGKEYANFILPSWAAAMAEEMAKDPKKKFLLFFDEMNQAEPGVLNALMPIVLKHTICGINFGDRIIVGAAGNESKQNESLSDINQPLRDRFKPIIYWETHTPDTWKEAFEYAHKAWDDILGEDFINEAAKYQNYWNSPRDVERVIFKWAKNNKGKLFEDPEDIVDRLMNCIWDEIDDSERESRKFSEDIKKYAQYLYDWCNGNVSGSSSRQRGKNDLQISKETAELISNALITGCVKYDGVDYFITRENVLSKDCFGDDSWGLNAEIIDKLVKKIESGGKKVKYETNEDAKKDMAKRKFADPEA